jgi:hypothetical protein
MPAGAGREAHPAGHSFFGRGALVLVLLFGQVPLASGQEPDLMQTLIAEDATLNNNVSPIKPRWQKNAGGRTFELGFGVEKMLSPNLDVQIGGVWKSLRPRNGPAKTAFGNVDVELKYVFLKLPEFQVAVVPQVSFPTSSHTLDEPTQVPVGGLLAWGGRLGSAAERGWQSYLRAIEFQGDLGYSHNFGGAGGDEIFFDLVLDYSMPYLDYSTAVRSGWPLKNMCVFMEFNFNQPLEGGDQSGVSLSLTPGVAYLTERHQVSVGMQVPLNHAAGKK